MPTRKRPYDPAKSTQAALDRKARDQEAQRLEAQGATVKRDRAGHIISAWRSNVFTLLLQRGAINLGQHDAYERLKERWAVWKGLEGAKDGADEVVDNGRSPPDRRSLVTDDMLRAGREVMGIMAHLTPIHVKLLSAFMVAIIEEDRAMSWRGIVERAIGVTVRDQQTRAVVGALEELRVVLQGPRERAA